MKLLESCSAISVAKLNESLTQYLLVVNDSKIGTKSLYVGVCKADKIGVKAGQPSTHFFMSFTITLYYSKSSLHWFQI